MLVERLIEGDRNQRMRLDRRPLGEQARLRRRSKHAARLVIAAATGGAWNLLSSTRRAPWKEAVQRHRLARGLFLRRPLTATTTPSLAGWAREQVCTYMCPWPRFQAGDARRAEPDRHLSEMARRAARQAQGRPELGHHAAIVSIATCASRSARPASTSATASRSNASAAASVDACNQTMARVDRPAGLIRWDTLANQQAKEKGLRAREGRCAPCTLLYTLLLVVSGHAGAFPRTDTELTVQRDRRAPISCALNRTATSATPTPSRSRTSGRPSSVSRWR